MPLELVQTEFVWTGFDPKQKFFLGCLGNIDFLGDRFCNIIIIIVIFYAFLPGEVTTLPTNSEDKVIDLQGEAVKVLKALEAVLGHLRKFLVDHSVLPLFEKTVSYFSFC